MSIYWSLRSQLTNARAFRAFFPLRQVLRDVLRLPLDHVYRSGLRPFPLVVDLNVTNRCNLGCNFCYNRDNQNNTEDELDLDELHRLFDEAEAYGAGFFLSGGEPLLRDDACTIVEHISSRGLAVGMVTNGVLLDEALKDRLLAGGCGTFVVSLHGPAEIHDAIMGRRGSHEAAMAAIRRLAAAMPPPGPVVNCVVTEQVMPHLGAFLDEILEVSNTSVRVAHPSFVTAGEETDHNAEWRQRLGDMPCSLLSYRHEIDERAFLDLGRLLRERRYRSVHTRPVLSADEIRRWYAPGFSHRRRCTFVNHSTVVNADGTVFPCQYYATPMGNVRDRSLEDIWQSERYGRFREVIRTRLLPACARCCKL